MTVRTTFALDVATESSIQRLSKLWKTSKAEVVRRSVAEAERAEASQRKMAPLEALEWLQTNGTMTNAKAETWARESRKGWEEGWRKREPKATRQANAKPRKKR